MARAFLLWWCAGAAAAAYGSEYGARLPLYDEPQPLARAHDAEDYRAHSPDAPAVLDYKYEEDTREKTEQSAFVEPTETDSRLRPMRKHRKRTDYAHSSDDFEKFDPEDDYTKIKPSNRFTRHRSHFIKRKLDKNNDYSPRYLNKRSRIKNMRDMDNEAELSIDESEDNNSKRSDSDMSRFTYRMTSERVIRRKPRDDYIRRKSDEEDIEKAEESVGRELETWQMEREDMMAHRRRPAVPPLATSDDESAPLRPKGSARQWNNYKEYDDEYYDMKRVTNVQNKLPSLVRRTQARPLVPAPPMRSIEDLLANRRLLPAPPSTPTTGASTVFTSTSTTVQSTSVTTAQPAIIIKKNSTLVNGSKELSFAEKSRLSILKKAQRKESVRSEPCTSKPPVLLQVTVKMPTVVVVEPPTSAQPWMRARAVTDDSPSRLRRVKQLMRHKLLANARSINELTDNWDDLVCDYVDMSLLDSGAQLVCRPSLTLMFIYLLVSVLK